MANENASEKGLIHIKLGELEDVRAELLKNSTELEKRLFHILPQETNEEEAKKGEEKMVWSSSPLASKLEDEVGYLSSVNRVLLLLLSEIEI